MITVPALFVKYTAAPESGTFEAFAIVPLIVCVPGTVTVYVADALKPLSVALCVILYEPAVVYVWTGKAPTGAVPVASADPSPQFTVTVTGVSGLLLLCEASVKVTAMLFTDVEPLTVGAASCFVTVRLLAAALE